MGVADISDGTWLWPEGLAHYVEAHKILLPAEFVEDVVLRGFTIPTNLDLDLLCQTPQDLSFWKEWCHRNARGLYVRRLLARMGF